MIRTKHGRDYSPNNYETIRIGTYCARVVPKRAFGKSTVQRTTLHNATDFGL